VRYYGPTRASVRNTKLATKVQGRAFAVYTNTAAVTKTNIPRPHTIDSQIVTWATLRVRVGHMYYILAAQHVRQLVFTHRLGQRQASVVLAARVVEVRMVKNA
jgi:hypothetical protein